MSIAAVWPQSRPVHVGGVVAHEFSIDANMRLTSEKHKRDHLGILASGEAFLTAGEIRLHMKAPAVARLYAGIVHTLETRAPCVWYCVYKENP